MPTSRSKYEAELLTVFKSLLKDQCYGSQGELAEALAERSFDNISQAKISRMLAKVGAVKTRNASSQMIYILPDELAVPKSKQAIQSVVLSVKNNGMQIILKTGIGGAPLIARMIDSMGETGGILGTLAGDDTIFIAPTSADRIGEITQTIIDMLDVKGMD